MSLLRESVFLLRLGWSRALARGGRMALVGLGIAAGAAALGAVLAGSLAAQDRSLVRSVGRIPSTDRAVRAAWGGIPTQRSQSLAVLDRAARDSLRTLKLGRPFAAMLFQERQLNGTLVDLGGLEHVGRWVRLTSGRYPTSCTRARCEVVQIAGAGPLPHLPDLRIVRVGRGLLTSSVPLGNLFTSERQSAVLRAALAYHRPATPPVLLTEGVAPLAAVPSLAPIYRTYTWVLPLNRDELAPWTAPRLLDRLVTARAQLSSAEIFELTAPDVELQAALADGRVAGRRLLLIGGEAAALLLAFTILAAATLRRDVHGAWRRLTWFGATGWQLAAAAAAEAATVAVAAAAIGWLAGIGLGAAFAQRLDSPPGAVLSHSVLAPHGWVTAAAIALAATLVLLAALAAPAVRLGGVSISALDLAGVAALVAIVVAFARGDADAGALASQSGTGVLLLLLPALVALVAAVLAVRLLGPALRALQRASAHAALPLRLAGSSLARNPGRAAVTVAFLVVSVGLALFAATYRATLARGQTDQAAYAVPRDFILRENLSELVPVLDAAPPARYGALGDATEVIRVSGDIPRVTGPQGFALLGVPSSTLRRLRGWRADFSAQPLGRLASRLASTPADALRGFALPAAARSLSVPASVRGDGVILSASIETTRGEFEQIRLGQVDPGRPVLLKGSIPRTARGGKLVSIGLGLIPTGLHGVANGELGVQPEGHGVLTLGVPSSGGRRLPVDYGSWTGISGASSIGNRVRFLLAPGVETIFRPRQATDGRAIPAVVSRGLAAAATHGGVLPVEVNGQPLRLRVAAVAKRFPTTQGEFVVADRQSLSTAMNAASPGSAVTNEIWLDTSRPELLHRPPFDTLAVSSHATVERDLRSDPLARATLLALAGAALAALALALLGLLLGLVADLRDERGELFDLEAQGAEPATLRRHLRLRVALLAAIGVAGGIATGAALSALVVRLVTVTAGAISPQPPLQLRVDWPLVVGALAVFALLAAVLASAATWRAFSAPAARAAEASA